MQNFLVDVMVHLVEIKNALMEPFRFLHRGYLWMNGTRWLPEDRDDAQVTIYRILSNVAAKGLEAGVITKEPEMGLQVLDKLAFFRLLEAELKLDPEANQYIRHCRVGFGPEFLDLAHANAWTALCLENVDPSRLEV